MEKAHTIPKEMSSVLIVSNGKIDFGTVPVQSPGKN